MKYISWFYGGIFILLFSAMPVRAEEAGAAAPPEQDQGALMEMDIDDLRKIKVATVYGASKYEQKVTEAPSSVSIVTAEDIKQYGYRTLADILRSLQSFNVTYDRNYHYAGVRGFGRPGDYNTRILVLVDGIRINDNVYDCVLLGSDFVIDVDTIYRVEVIRGPGSSLYGSNAFFAVVNIITKRGRHLNGLEVSGAAASYDTYYGRATYGQQFQNTADVILSGSLYDSDGQTLYFKEFDQRNPLSDPRATPDGITEHTDYDRYRKYFLKLAYYDFTLEGAYVSRTKGLSAASFDIDFNDPRNKTLDRRAYWDLKYERSVTSRVGVMGRLYAGEYDYTADLLYSGIRNKDFGVSAWWGGEVKVTVSDIASQKIIAGAEYRENTVQKQYNVDENPFAVYLDDSRSSTIWAAYIQDAITLSPALSLSAGVRYDDYGTFGGTTNPRLALIASPAETSVFKLLYGTAFRAPTDYELRYYLDSVQKPNPELKPELITTYELVYEQYVGRNNRFSASVFRYIMKDSVSLTVDPADTLLMYGNVSKIESTGFELTQEGAGTNGFKERVSYSFQKSKNAFTGEPLSNSPEHMIKANVLAPLGSDNVTAGLEEQYTSARKTPPPHGGDAGSFFITNLTVFSQKLAAGLEASASVYNLFDRKYGDPGSTEHAQDTIEQDGRNYRFKVTYHF